MADWLRRYPRPYEQDDPPPPGDPRVSERSILPGAIVATLLFFGPYVLLLSLTVGLPGLVLGILLPPALLSLFRALGGAPFGRHGMRTMD